MIKFILGVLVSAVISIPVGAIFSPVILSFIDPWGVWVVELVHGPPPGRWSVNRVGACTAGDIGNRAKTEEAAGTLDDIGAYTEQVWVCGDEAFDEPDPIDRFAAIARTFASCFGFENGEKARFWVDTASPAVCATGLYGREDRQFIRTDLAKSRIICMGDVTVDYRATDYWPNDPPKPRPCTDDELARYDFDRLQLVE